MGTPRIDVKDLRTGTNFKRKLTSATSILIRYIWIKNGGVEAVAKRLSLFSQQLNFWQTTGKVPLKHVGKIARTLGVPMLALNYEGVMELLGHGLSWKSVVKMTVDDKQTLAVILKAKPPEHEKGGTIKV